MTISTSRPIPAILTRLSLFFLLLFSLTLWAVSLRGLDPSQMTDLGLVSLLPPLALVVPLLLSMGFGLLLAQARLDERLLLLYSLALIFFIHASPHLLYGTLRYSWAWKHLGILDYIQRHGSVNPGINVLGAYHNWPGFFALGTFFTDLGGFVDLSAFAGWAPVFFNSLYLLALLFLLKPMSIDRRLPWLAIWIFFLTNWVGQDYFSPQALSFFFYLLILGICLRYFVRLPSASKSPSSRSIIARLDDFFHRLDGYSQPIRSRLTDISPAQRLGLGFVLLLLFLAVVSSHQLTPFMAISAVLALWFFRYLSWRNLPFLMILITLVWLILPASSFFSSILGDLFESLGRLGENIGSNLQDLTLVSTGQIAVALAGRLLTLLIFLMALLGFVRRLQSRVLDLPALLLMLSPLPMVLASSYGGEILFRIYFFALPFMAFLAAGLFLPAQAALKSWRMPVAVTSISAVMLLGLLLAYYGKEEQYYFTPAEVSAAELVYNSAADSPPGSILLVEGSRNYPSQFRNYESFVYVPLDREPPESLAKVLAQPAETLQRWMSDPRYNNAYLIITRSQEAYTDALGVMPPGSLQRIEQALRLSPQFTVVFDDPGAVVFTLTR